VQFGLNASGLLLSLMMMMMMMMMMRSIYSYQQSDESG